MTAAKILLTFLFVLLSATCVSAQTGSSTAVVDTVGGNDCVIKGRVFDAESGKTMPYTNIFIAGTNIGTMAYTDGYFIMRGLQPGTYTIKASYISYGVGSETVTVGLGQIVDIEFRLDVQAIMVDVIDVTAERRLVEVERTGSSHYISSQQLDSMPLDQMVDMIAQQPGVTLYDNEIHIRGGRADDTQFIIDGMSVNDPLAGGGYGYQIDPALINEIEVLTGGFNAEYGQAVSGIVNVSTKEGSDRVSGKFSVKRDYLFGQVDKTDRIDWRNLTEFNEAQNRDEVKGMLSGPCPISGGLRKLGLELPGKQYLLASATMDLRDGYLPIYSRHNRLESPVYDDEFWSPRQRNDWNGLVKWSWHITPSHKLNLTSSRQIGISQGFNLPGEGYSRPFIEGSLDGDPLLADLDDIYGLDRYLVFTTENILTQLYYRQVLSDREFFEVTIGRNFNRLHANVNGEDDFTTYTPYDGDESESSSNEPESQAIGSADRWHDHYTEAWTLNGSYSFMKDTTNQFKTGLELSFTEMQMVDLKSNLSVPPDGKLAINEDIFRAHPVVGSAYFQDTITYRGLIVNVGLRGDAWAPGREVEDVMEHNEEYLFITQELADEFNDSTFGAFGQRWKARLSPRLGLSFPVTERDKFFFNYGHFNQWPRFSYVYPQLRAKTATKIQLLGNPNLDPKITVEYETGVQHEFENLWSMGITVFNRDIYGYAKSVSMEQVDIEAADTPDPNDEGTAQISPVRYFNGDSARSLGIELSIIKRTTKWLSGSASIELQRSTGTNSKADEGYLQAAYTDTYDPTSSSGGLKREPLLWDKPWSFSLNLDFSVVDDNRPELFGWTMPRDWSLNLLARAESGQRYTPQYWDPSGSAVEGDINSKIGPTTSTVNLRFSKFWKLDGRRKVTFYIEGRNIFNHKNYRRINPFTGEGYRVGDYNPRWVNSWQEKYPGLTTDSYEYALGVVNPSYIINPRVILWGVSYSW